MGVRELRSFDCDARGCDTQAMVDADANPEEGWVTVRVLRERTCEETMLAYCPEHSDGRVASLRR